MRQGYTLLELLVVVVIVGVLASVAVTRFGKNNAQNTFGECQHMKIAEKTLRAILAAEHNYRLGEEVFTSDLTKLSVSDVNARSATDYPVTYDISATTANLFVGRANYTRRTPPLQLMELQYDEAQLDDTSADPREQITQQISCN